MCIEIRKIALALTPRTPTAAIQIRKCWGPVVTPRLSKTVTAPLVKNIDPMNHVSVPVDVRVENGGTSGTLHVLMLELQW